MSEISIDNVSAIVGLIVVPDGICPVEMLIGNNFLSQPHVSFYKNGSDITFGTCVNTSLVNSLGVVRSFTVLTEDLICCAENFKLLIIHLLNRYRKCVALNLSEMGKTNCIEMDIKLNSQNPVCYNPYRLGEEQKLILKGMIAELLENNIIRESTSSYASPIILIAKPNKTFRLCVDYRKLNAITVKEKHPIPLIDDQIDKLVNNKFFTLLDLFSGYYQIPMSKDSIHKTAFITPDGQYEFLRMSFGLTNAPFVFQRMMNKIIGELENGTAYPYLDDILIPSKSFEEGLVKLEKVFEVLNKYGLTVQPTKCKFLMEKVTYLGREISGEGVRPNQKKVEAIVNLSPPKNKKELRQFCGLANYFRRFVKNYAFLLQPITKLLKKNVMWSWSSEQQEAFDLVKQSLSHGPILKIFDPLLLIQLHCDASSIGVGGILMQKHENKWHPVAFFSKQCTYEQSRYHSYELETMAVVFALRHFRVYLLGRHFTIFTDCAAVRATAVKKDLVPRVARWWLEIQEFTFDIEYKPGSKMNHVDYLSRHPVVDSELVANIINLTESEWVIAVQNTDEQIQNIIKILQGTKNSLNKNYFDNYVYKNNLLYRKINNTPKWVVPKSCRWLICKLNHDDAGHFAYEKTIERIQRNYWFSQMTSFVKKYVAACLNCLYMKSMSGRKAGFMHPIPKVNVPFDTIHLDHLGPFVKSKHKNSYILVIVDAFTKFVFLEAVKSTKVKYVLKTLDNFVFLFGAPNKIISDRGSAFTSKKMGEYCSNFGIKHILNAVATPRANGQCERYNLTVLNSLRCYSANDDREDLWDTHLKLIQFSINSCVNKSTGKSPSQILMGINPRQLADAKILSVISDSLIQENLETLRNQVSNTIQQKQKENERLFNSKRKAGFQCKVNDLVMVRRNDFGSNTGPKKLIPKFKGPFRVVKILPNDRFVVADLRNTKQSTSIVAIDSLKPWVVLNDQASQPL